MHMLCYAMLCYAMQVLGIANLFCLGSTRRFHIYIYIYIYIYIFALPLVGLCNSIEPCHACGLWTTSGAHFLFAAFRLAQSPHKACGCRHFDPLGSQTSDFHLGSHFALPLVGLCNSIEPCHACGLWTTSGAHFLFAAFRLAQSPHKACG